MLSKTLARSKLQIFVITNICKTYSCNFLYDRDKEGLEHLMLVIQNLLWAGKNAVVQSGALADDEGRGGCDRACKQDGSFSCWNIFFVLRKRASLGRDKFRNVCTIDLWIGPIGGFKVKRFPTALQKILLWCKDILRLNKSVVCAQSMSAPN
jgi:hypothetical protein